MWVRESGKIVEIHFRSDGAKFDF